MIGRVSHTTTIVHVFIVCVCMRTHVYVHACMCVHSARMCWYGCLSLFINSIIHLNLSYFNDTQIIVILARHPKTAKFNNVNRQICVHALAGKGFRGH